MYALQVIHDDMDTRSALLNFCAENPLVTCGFTGFEENDPKLDVLIP